MALGLASFAKCSNPFLYISFSLSLSSIFFLWVFGVWHFGLAFRERELSVCIEMYGDVKNGKEGKANAR